MRPRYKVLDLFCGTGGFSKGFENQGDFEVVLGIDLLTVAIETFKLNHSDALTIAGDIQTIAPQYVEENLGLGSGKIDVIIGGPPCQGFSSIRPHRSLAFEDPRNNLFDEFASYVAYFSPNIFVFENVVGLATHNGGRTMCTIESRFQDLGYSTDWKIINAAHFGVPQKRERLILLGISQGCEVSFPSPTHASYSGTIGHRERGRMIIPDLFSMNGGTLQPAPSVSDAIDDLPQVQSGEAASEYDRAPRTEYQASRRAGSRRLTIHEATDHSPKMLEIIRHSGPNISYIPKHLISSGFSSCYSRLAPDEPSVTITVNFVHPASNRCIHPTLDRALTPREGARLQSFDDSFMFVGNRTQIVKQIGNAVPPLLGEAIAAHVSKLLSDGAKRFSASQSHS